jgi:hypothetical protein
LEEHYEIPVEAQPEEQQQSATVEGHETEVLQQQLKKTLQLKRRVLKRNRRRPRSKGQICRISATLRDSLGHRLKREGYVAGIDEGNNTLQLQRKVVSY